tara:strand:+ start:394 stop:696 length:303 start_codon:yes stop_codon:yes gene_type:complete
MLNTTVTAPVSAAPTFVRSLTINTTIYTVPAGHHVLVKGMGHFGYTSATTTYSIYINATNIGSFGKWVDMSAGWRWPAGTTFYTGNSSYCSILIEEYKDA